MPRIVPLGIAAWSLGLIVSGIAFGFQSWSFVAIAVGLISAFGLGYGVVTRSWVSSVSIAMLATAIGLIVSGALVPELRGPFVAAGVASLIAIGALAVVVHLINTIPQRSPHMPASDAASMHLTAADRAELHELARILHAVQDRLEMSDQVRSVLFGDRDREILEHTLQARLDTADFDGARALCDSIDAVSELRRKHGEALRAILNESLESHREHDLHDMVATFEALLQHRDWQQATELAARMREIAPDAAGSQQLDARIEQARQSHKAQLESQLLEASQRDDVEAAMRTLKELDRYMTREEAERLSTEAQSVIERHRERISTAFQLALREKRWIDAAKHGNQIIAEYPNTKMAQEVRSMIAVIRTRATQASMYAGAGEA